MSHETLVLLAKTFAPIWMMGFLVIVVIRTYNPKRRSGYDHAARSILGEHERDE
jgi:cbb3-type cytochrome oxidase subunit 3